MLPLQHVLFILVSAKLPHTISPLQSLISEWYNEKWMIFKIHINED